MEPPLRLTMCSPPREEAVWRNLPDRSCKIRPEHTETLGLGYVIKKIAFTEKAIAYHGRKKG